MVEVPELKGGLGLAPVSRRKPREPLSTWLASGSDVCIALSCSRAPLVGDLARWLRALKTGTVGDLGLKLCSVMHKPLAKPPEGQGRDLYSGPGLGGA